MSVDPSNAVVITGVGVVSPIGVGRADFWTAMLQGTSGIRRLDGRMGDVGELAVGGTLRDFDPKAHVRPRKALKVMCREIQTAFAAASLAQTDAQLVPEQLPSDRLATVFGSEMMSGDAEELVDAMLEFGIRDDSPQVANFGSAAMRKMYPLWMLKYLPNMATCHVGIALGALGPNNTVVLGDTSGLAALVEGSSVLDRGMADCLLTGAAGTRISSTRFIFHAGLSAGSVRQPIASSSRPFARDRDGVIGGEGAAVLVLEKANQAAARGATPLTQVVGSAIRFVSTVGDPRRVGQATQLAIEAALAAADLPASEVGAVVSHAMGHPEIDAAEATVLHQLFSAQTPVVAPIAALGHTGAAAGSLALVTAALISESNVVPPTVNADGLDPACQIRLLSAAEELKKPAVLVTGFTLQGHAAAVVLRR